MTRKRIDLFRYHDLTQRLTVFAVDGGGWVRGEREDLEIVDAEPAYGPQEREIVRLAGVLTLNASRSTSGHHQPTLGLVLTGASVLILTTERVIVMLTNGQSQLGQVRPDEIHAIVFPWDVIDSVSMPITKSLADRIAGERAVSVYVAVGPAFLEFIPHRRESSGGRSERIGTDQAMALLVRTAADHRLSVSPEWDHARLRTLIVTNGGIDGTERVATVTSDRFVRGLPPHLVGRIATSARAKRAAATLLLAG